MDDSSLESQLKRVRRYAWGTGVFWTVVILSSLAWNVEREGRETFAVAKTQAQIAFRKDVLYRRWNAGHGGVYVPATESTPPNPYIDPEHRTVTTTTGQRLTFMNPSYMTRQVLELGELVDGVQGHLTSLKPIRPENAPDAWETAALLAFEDGETEVSSIERLDGETRLRLMRPLVTEEACLRCHGAQGYEVGDIRGGLSVAVPMASLFASARTQNKAIAITHGFLWWVGMGGLGVSVRQIVRRTRDRAAITAVRRKYSERLRMLTTAVEAAGTPIMLTDPDGNIEWVNAAFTELTGYRSDEVIGRHARILTSGQHDPAFYSDLWNTVLSGHVWRGEMINRRKDGTLYPEEMTIAPVRNDCGEVDHFIAVKLDITERKGAETRKLQLLKAEQECNHLHDAIGALERVLGVVSHELRTPLAGMRAMAEFLLQDGAQETAEFDTFLHGIHDEVVKMSGTVNDTLEIARMSSGRAHWDWDEFEVGTVCEEALSTVRPLVDAEKVSLILRVTPEDVTMIGDAGAVRRLIVNLLSNAIRHTPTGSVEVDVTQTDRDDAQWAKIEVRDTGAGIEPDIARRLGVAFALNSGAVGERHVAGSGLGLSICRGIVAAHGGRIHFDTGAGQGTTVSAEMRRDLSEPASVEGAAEIVCEVNR